ncbi:MAG: trehalose-6-phosphate synthase [Rhodospirillales bacterium]|nr:trehalose-6-phosphate synthase [Rhodospirillales bacterium]
MSAPPPKPRLVVVSNRVPLPTERGPRAGGLAVALADALAPGSLWFGWSGRRTARAGTAPPELAAADGITYATIDLSESEHRLYYAGFSNTVLWPLLHFRLGLVHYRAEEYQAWREVNRRFAAALAPLLRPDDLIWVHDYHLIPLGAELRARGVAGRIGFFLHTPFVPPEVLRALPRAEQVLAGLCAYDVVGFHTEEHRAGFLRGVRDILGLVPDEWGGVTMEGRRAHSLVDPIGIDAEGFAASAVEAASGAELRRLRVSLAGRALAIGVDRLDYSKGLPQRLDAFGRLLERHPEYRRRVSFLQVAARSREDVGEYRRLRGELDRIAGETIGRYSEFDWVPIRYLTRPLRRATLAGFYRAARMAVVTPLRDGMNLVAKEYVAAQDANDPGVLILSRFAGAAAELDAALIVNPFDPDEIADAMHSALAMRVEERQARHRALAERVFAATARRWSERFLAALAPPA